MLILTAVIASQQYALSPQLHAYCPWPRALCLLFSSVYKPLDVELWILSVFILGFQGPWPFVCHDWTNNVLCFHQSQHGKVGLISPDQTFEHQPFRVMSMFVCVCFFGEQHEMKWKMQVKRINIYHKKSCLFM